MRVAVGRRAALAIAEPLVERPQLRAQVDDRDEHLDTMRLPAVLFGDAHQLLSEPAALLVGRADKSFSCTVSASAGGGLS